MSILKKIVARLQQTASNVTVYGGIVNLHTKEEYEWDDTPVAEVVKNCKALKGTKYGVDWKYAGDLDPSEGDISCSDDSSFAGKNAVAQFLKKFG